LFLFLFTVSLIKNVRKCNTFLKYMQTMSKWEDNGKIRYNKL
jgi:hypothetical protein